MGFGGVGLAALDIAKAKGAQLWPLYQQKKRLNMKSTVQTVIIYEGPKTKDESKAFSNELKSKSLKGGYDIIYDPIGDCYTEPAFRAIGWKGKYLVVGFVAGKFLNFNKSHAFKRSVTCRVWGTFTGLEVRLIRKILRKLTNYFLRQIKPLISKEVPMENAVEAIKMIGNRGVIGKVVLVNK